MPSRINQNKEFGVMSYAEERWRELCWNKLDSRAAPQTRQRIDLYVSQTVPDVPHPLEAKVISDYTLWWITPDFNDYVDVNLTYRLFPVTFLLASPDEGGSGIILQLDLHTYAQASDQHGWAAANFSKPVLRGLRFINVEEWARLKWIRIQAKPTTMRITACEVQLVSALA